MKGLKKGAVILLFAAGIAVAAGIVITATGAYGNLSNMQGTTIATSIEVRTAAVSQASGLYRSINGLSQLPSGSSFTMVYSDGSSEKVGVVNPFSSMGSVPIPGTQSSGSNNVCQPGSTTCSQTNVN